jgi:hypothetical protein
MVGFLEKVRLAFFCCKCTFQCYVCIHGKHDKLQPLIFFCIQLLCTHMFRGFVLMFVLEGELKSHAHAFVFMYV